MIENLLIILGRFNFTSQKRSYVPRMLVRWRFHQLRHDLTSPTLGHSPTQARATLLVLASLIHALFFVIMGTGPQYPSLLIAFALAAFARALLTGTLFSAMFLDILPMYLT